MDQNNVFKKYVKIIEIENTSFCNRKCSFCGNSVIDRFTERYTMNESIYLKVLDELAQIDYRGVLNFNRYNEPFADKIVLDRIRMARTRLQDACLMSFTNSDYLDEEYLHEIRDAGLDVLNIQIYSEDKLSSPEVLQKMNATRVKLGSYPGEVVFAEGVIECILQQTGMQKVSIQYRYFDLVGNSRGGMIKALEKQPCSDPCYQPVISVNIDYNGNVMPCCNLRSDWGEHKPYILGNIQHDWISDIYSSKNATQFRKRLLSGDRPDVCKYCNDTKMEVIRGE